MTYPTSVNLILPKKEEEKIETSKKVETNPFKNSYHNPKKKLILDSAGKKLKETDGHIFPSSPEEKEICDYFDSLGILTFLE